MNDSEAIIAFLIGKAVFRLTAIADSVAVLTVPAAGASAVTESVHDGPPAVRAESLPFHQVAADGLVMDTTDGAVDLNLLRQIGSNP